jgi:hypothetical protein
MKTRRLACTSVASLAIAIVALAATGKLAQVKSGGALAAKSPDPAILWQFDTHG